MPKFPWDVTQDAAVRALVRAGGQEVPRRGKGSHRTIRMPNGQRVVLPERLKTGLLHDMIKQSDLTTEESLDLL